MLAEIECLPLGVGQNGEGICLDLRLGQHHFLLDCGLKDLSSLELFARKLAAKEHHWSGLFCSHAHADHSRGIDALQAIAPDLPIYTSAVTAHLLTLNCPSASLASIFPVDWGETIEIEPNLLIKLLPSGHLPGAASIWLTYCTQDQDYNVLYTGDFYISNSRLVQGLKLEQFRGSSLDVLILEGSLGTTKHPHRRTQEQNLIHQINQAIASGYSVLFPVPKVGIGQEILMLLRSHHAFTGKDLDIWIDRGIGTGCDLYMEILPYLPLSVQNFAQHQSLFWDSRISPRIQSLDLINQSNYKSSNPAIILVDQDNDWLHDPKLQAQLKDQLQGSNYQIFVPEQNLELKTELTNFHIPFSTYLLAEHSDISGTTQLIHNLKPQHVVFIHGNSNYLADLANLDELSNRYHIHCPSVSMNLELPLGDSLHISHPQNQLSPYAGELSELSSEVMLSLPIELTQDRRWLDFSDTGLIEARWQGEDLLIRGISPRELSQAVFNQRSPSKDSIQASCISCRFYSGQFCLNRESPLAGMKVSSDAYCQGFEKIPADM
ncbi:putative exonuclease of the beta-lactamase fold involved in RNA processing [Synechococcus sp. PCC 7502]|uniref:MBL fold metallo-hydrolase n=1 Tax=Synechococcus sp. PCC 7502 TaxID=1173263 RepID=UPI00029FDB79|nr:MBL fold metallo-hydrolase [Synechococcus sp. PCC 7502]AFY72677.1 putative exonuclease of the beta-lactamase fold involved in RNA processing [Synechococcus sp. PCC 7502]